MKALFFILAATLLLSSCSTSHRNYRSQGHAYSYYGKNDVAAITGGTPASYGDASPGIVYIQNGNSEESATTFNADQMIIYNASMDVTVRNVDTANKQIVATAKKYEGYVVSISNRSTSVRVKSEYLEKAMMDLEKIGKVTDKNVYGSDISNDYANLSVRRDNAYKARARYLELLAKAEDVKAALEVEKELERLNNEIDMLEMQLKNIQQQVDYSLITVSLTERKQPGIIGYVFIGLYKSVKWLFVWN